MYRFLLDPIGLRERDTQITEIQLIPSRIFRDLRLLIQDSFQRQEIE